MSDTDKGNAQSIIDFATKAAEPVVRTIVTPWGDEEQVLILHTEDGSEVRTARDMFRDLQPAPERREGTIVAHDLASFVAATNRDKNEDSAIFADVPARKLTAVLDFHKAGGNEPRWGRDRIAYGFQFSPQFVAWVKACDASMDQKAFSLLIDNRLGDIDDGNVQPGSLAAEFARRRGIRLATVADLVVFTRTIAAKCTTESEEQIDEHTGDVSIQFKKRGNVKDTDGKPVPVPQAFALSIPILSGIGATEYKIAVRLRYDISDRGITWRIELNAVDKYIQAAIEEAVGVVRRKPDETTGADGKPQSGGCGLPVFMAAAP